jgi:predicted  nucleic acid-binding Zn-ribbon protein
MVFGPYISKSPYYTMKEPMRREIYATKCMKYLTYLDYSALEATGKSIEKRLADKEDRITELEKQIAEIKSREASVIKQTQEEALEAMKKIADQKIAEALARVEGTIKDLEALKTVKHRKIDN